MADLTPEEEDLYYQNASNVDSLKSNQDDLEQELMKQKRQEKPITPGEKLFTEMAAKYLEEHQPDIADVIMRSASKGATPDIIAKTGLDPKAKGILSAIVGMGQGFVEARNDEDARRNLLLTQMAKFKPNAGDPYAERKDKEFNDKVYNDMARRFAMEPIVQQRNLALAAYNQLEELRKDPTNPNAVAMIYKFMKAFDPTSVVRESEYKMGQNAASLFRKAINKAKDLAGQGLSEKTKAEFVKAARDALIGIEFMYQQVKTGYENEGIARQLPSNMTGAIFSRYESGPGAFTDIQTQKYKTEKGEFSEAEMRKMFFDANPKKDEEAFQNWLILYK